MRASIPSLLCLPILALALQGCAPPSAAIKPIAVKNQDNISALATNTSTLLTMQKPVLEALGNTLIMQHIGNLRGEFISVVGAPMMSKPRVESWDDAVARRVGMQHRFSERYQYVKSAIARGLSAKALDELKHKEGWVYLAASDANFTPLKVHGLVKQLAELQRNIPATSIDYYQAAEKILLPNDPGLQLKRGMVDGALGILGALHEEVMRELRIAKLHSQAMAGYANSDLDFGKTLNAMNNNDIKDVLKELGNKYIDNPTYRKAALQLLSTGVDSLTGDN